MFPKDWRFAESLVHEIWAPSAFCAETFRSAMELPVTVLPYTVAEPPASSINMRSRLSIRPDTFMGLAIMDIQSCPARKNPWAHVRAWREAFGDDPDAVLVMKLRVGKRTRIVLDELRDLARGASNIRLVSDDLDNLKLQRCIVPPMFMYLCIAPKDLGSTSTKHYCLESRLSPRTGQPMRNMDRGSRNIRASISN